MAYIAYDTTEQDLVIAQAIYHREQEHYLYELNQKNYRKIVQDMKAGGLPDNWPQAVTQYRHASREALLSSNLDDATFDLVARLQYRDKLIMAIRTERMEQAKGESVLKALLDQLPEGPRRASALAAAKAQREKAAVS